jgi:hypothetical protein
VLVLGAYSQQALQGLRSCALEPITHPRPERCGAVVIYCPGNLNPIWLRSSRAALGRRGRVFVQLAGEHLPQALLALSYNGLEPKRVLLSDRSTDVGTSSADVVIVAAQARPGGLVVERAGLC